MRRIMGAVVVAAALVGLSACAESGATPTATSTSASDSATTSPAGAGNEALKAACTTVREARMDQVTPFFTASETLSDTTSTAAEVEEAAAELTAMYKALGAEIKKAAGQTDDAVLKAGLTAFAGAIDAAGAAVTAAGTDRAKLQAATETDAFKQTERKVLDLCFDVLNP